MDQDQVSNLNDFLKLHYYPGSIAIGDDSKITISNFIIKLILGVKNSMPCQKRNYYECFMYKVRWNMVNVIANSIDSCSALRCPLYRLLYPL